MEESFLRTEREDHKMRVTGIDHVQRLSRSAGERRPARKAHAALVVDGLDRLVATLETEGDPIRRAEPLDGRRRVYVDDPFGNRIELIEA